MADFGGEMRLMNNGTPIRFRGTFNLDAANVTVTVVTNMDGSISRQLKPDGFGADLKELEDSGVANWNALLRQAPTAMNIIEEATGVTHVFTNAVFEGAPMIDRETGSVTGLKIRSPAYQKLVF